MNEHHISNQADTESKYLEQKQELTECMDISECQLVGATPKYSNLKQEIMAFHISSKKYERTYNKTKTFLRSFATPKYKTLSYGNLSNKTFDIKESWKKGERMTVDELFVLKLVVDYDIIHSELSACTEQRLSHIFHLRRQLFIVLNKYGSRHFPKHGKLFLPVTQKTTTMGPLLVTGSSIVSDILASKEGTTITIIPESNGWRAFDATKLSDYPKKQQWIIDFIYLPIIQIKTYQSNESPSVPICKI